MHPAKLTARGGNFLIQQGGKFDLEELSRRQRQKVGVMK
jgi:hypothetical protein